MQFKTTLLQKVGCVKKDKNKKKYLLTFRFGWILKHGGGEREPVVCCSSFQIWPKLWTRMTNARSSLRTRTRKMPQVYVHVCVCATGKHEAFFSVCMCVIPVGVMPSVERLGTKGKTTKHPPSQLPPPLSHTPSCTSLNKFIISSF